jgi:hypothetical protein
MIVQNLTMAVATSARYVDTGIMGIGFDTDESLPPGAKTYPNIIDDMVAQGLINTRAYSLWLDDLGTVYHQVTRECRMLTHSCQMRVQELCSSEAMTPRSTLGI